MNSLSLFLAVGLIAAVDAPTNDEANKELAKFQGTWKYVAMDAEGTKVPEALFRSSSIIIADAGQFTAKDPFTTYKGAMKLNLTKKPKELDLVFLDGPEKGNTALGIYELEGDVFKLCLGLTGKPRPSEFVSKPGSGHVLEVLKREAASDDLRQLAGTWTMVSAEEGGKELPADVVKPAKLVITGNKHDVKFGDNHIVGTHVLDANKKPKTIDATDTEGRFKGQTTLGIYELKGDEFKVCFAPPDKERPKEFTTKSGTGTLLHVWKRSK